MDDHQAPHYQPASDKRNRWFKDKFVTATDFSLEQRYMIERRRMLTRAVAGWGMVYGMDLSLFREGNSAGLKLSAGLAVDRHGRELFLPDSTAYLPRDLILLGELHELTQKLRSAPKTAAGDKQEHEPRGSYQGLALLSAHYGERAVDMVRSNRSCECGENEYNHLQEVVQLSLTPLHEGEAIPWGFENCSECECQPPYGAFTVHEHKIHQTAPHDRGPHDRLAACLAKHFIADEGANLCSVNGVATALHDPLPLAVVYLRINHCGQAEIEKIVDANHPRKLLKNNDLLFDLVRGCDLTRIANVSWAAWHRAPQAIPMHQFIEKFTCANKNLPPDDGKPADNAKDDIKANYEIFWGEPHDTDFKFEFTGPVQIATLTPEVVQIIVYLPSDESGWLRTKLVPINGLLPLPRHDDDPIGTTRGALVQVSAPWVNDELRNRNTLLKRDTCRVEIHIRGDLILDARGQAVDANALGMRATPSGNGTPGGSFVSVFSIASDAK